DMRVIRSNRLGPGTARNSGARVANGEVLLFIDSDCVAPSDWVVSVLKTIDQSGTVVGGPATVPRDAACVAKAVTYITHTWIGGLGTRWRLLGLIPGYRLRGMNLGILAALFASSGGFKPLWYGEDTEFSERLTTKGAKIRNCEHATVIH